MTEGTLLFTTVLLFATVFASQRKGIANQEANIQGGPGSGNGADIYRDMTSSQNYADQVAEPNGATPLKLTAFSGEKFKERFGQGSSYLDGSFVVGWIGGDGPESAPNTWQQLIDMSNKAISSAQLPTHIPIVIYNSPFHFAPSVPALQYLSAMLNRLGATEVASICNSAHVFIPQVQQVAPSMPWLDIVRLGVAAMKPFMDSHSSLAVKKITVFSAKCDQQGWAFGKYEEALKEIGSAWAFVKPDTYGCSIVKSGISDTASKPLDECVPGVERNIPGGDTAGSDDSADDTSSDGDAQAQQTRREALQLNSPQQPTPMLSVSGTEATKPCLTWRQKLLQDFFEAAVNATRSGSAAVVPGCTNVGVTFTQENVDTLQQHLVGPDRVTILDPVRLGFLPEIVRLASQKVQASPTGAARAPSSQPQLPPSQTSHLRRHKGKLQASRKHRLERARRSQPMSVATSPSQSHSPSPPQSLAPTPPMQGNTHPLFPSPPGSPTVGGDPLKGVPAPLAQWSVIYGVISAKDPQLARDIYHSAVKHVKFQSFHNGQKAYYFPMVVVFHPHIKDLTQLQEAAERMVFAGVSHILLEEEMYSWGLSHQISGADSHHLAKLVKPQAFTPDFIGKLIAENTVAGFQGDPYY